MQAQRVLYSGLGLRMTKFSRMGVRGMYWSVASCARSPYAKSTGVLFVTNPVIVLGLPEHC